MQEHCLAGNCCSNCHIGIYIKDQAVEGHLADVHTLKKTAYLPYVRCCVSLKWAHTANYSDFTQCEVPLLGSASTLVYIWIWHWNIHSSAQTCVRARCRRVNMIVEAVISKNCESFAKASLRIPLQQFVFLVFLQLACIRYHPWFLDPGRCWFITIAEGTDVIYFAVFVAKM